MYGDFQVEWRLRSTGRRGLRARPVFAQRGGRTARELVRGRRQPFFIPRAVGVCEVHCGTVNGFAYWRLRQTCRVCDTGYGMCTVSSFHKSGRFCTSKHTRHPRLVREAAQALTASGSTDRSLQPPASYPRWGRGLGLGPES